MELRTVSSLIHWNSKILPFPMPSAAFISRYAIHTWTHCRWPVIQQCIWVWDSNLTWSKKITFIAFYFFNKMLASGNISTDNEGMNLIKIYHLNIQRDIKTAGTSDSADDIESPKWKSKRDEITSLYPCISLEVDLFELFVKAWMWLENYYCGQNKEKKKGNNPFICVQQYKNKHGKQTKQLYSAMKTKCCCIFKIHLQILKEGLKFITM